MLHFSLQISSSEKETSMANGKGGMMHDSPEYTFCPKCSGLLAYKLLKKEEPERLVCEKCSFIFFIDSQSYRLYDFYFEG